MVATALLTFASCTGLALKDEGDSLHGDWTANYTSLTGYVEKVSAQYGAEVKDGSMTKISLGEALDRYGANLIIAATGAIAKKGTGPDAEARVIYDCTNGVFLNHGIRIRDQVRFPTAPDVKAMMAENYAEGGTHFQLGKGVPGASIRCFWCKVGKCPIRGSSCLVFDKLNFSC